MNSRSPNTGEIEDSGYEFEPDDWCEWYEENYVIRWYDSDELLFHNKLEDSAILLNGDIVSELCERVLQFDPGSNDGEVTSIKDRYQRTIKIQYQDRDFIFTSEDSRTTVEYSLVMEVFEFIREFYPK